MYLLRCTRDGPLLLHDLYVLLISHLAKTNNLNYSLTFIFTGLGFLKSESIKRQFEIIDFCNKDSNEKVKRT